MQKWRFEVLGAVDSPITRLLNPAENAYQQDFIDNWTPADIMVIAALINPDQFIRKSSSCHATIELNGILTRGQMIIDHNRKNPDNAEVIQSVDEKIYKNLLLWTVGHPDGALN